MSTLYIVRHGQSLGNISGGFAGRSDYPLSDLGRTQARMTADYLKDAHIDVVISSTLSRAYDTALPIALDRGLPVLTREDILEMNFGDWEGMKIEEVEAAYPEEFNHWMKQMCLTACPGGESTVECFNRTVKAIHDIAETYEGKDVCVVTHGALIKGLLCYLHGMPVEDIQKAAWVNNASVTKLSYEGGKFSIVYENQSDHMGDKVTGVSKRIASLTEK